MRGAHALDTCRVDALTNKGYLAKNVDHIDEPLGEQQEADPGGSAR
jgi:hypothetical protein